MSWFGRIDTRMIAPEKEHPVRSLIVLGWF